MPLHKKMEIIDLIRHIQLPDPFETADGRGAPEPQNIQKWLADVTRAAREQRPDRKLSLRAGLAVLERIGAAVEHGGNLVKTAENIRLEKAWDSKLLPEETHNAAIEALAALNDADLPLKLMQQTLGLFVDPSNNPFNLEEPLHRRHSNLVVGAVWLAGSSGALRPEQIAEMPKVISVALRLLDEPGGTLRLCGLYLTVHVVSLSGFHARWRSLQLAPVFASAVGSGLAFGDSPAVIQASLAASFAVCSVSSAIDSDSSHWKLLEETLWARQFLSALQSAAATLRPGLVSLLRAIPAWASLLGAAVIPYLRILLDNFDAILQQRPEPEVLTAVADALSALATAAAPYISARPERLSDFVVVAARLWTSGVSAAPVQSAVCGLVKVLWAVADPVTLTSQLDRLVALDPAVFSSLARQTC